MVRFGEPSSYIQHIALEKEQTSPVLCSLHRSRVPRRQRTQSSPNDDTAKVLTKHKTNKKKCYIWPGSHFQPRVNPWDHSERKESNAKTTQTPPAGGPKSVSLFRWCIKRDIVVFTPLNYIQTFKIQIFFFLRNVGHAFLLNLHILREALELRVTQQTWQDPKFKYATALSTSIIEKQRNTNYFLKKKISSRNCCGFLQKDMEIVFAKKMYKDSNHICQIHVK